MTRPNLPGRVILLALKSLEQEKNHILYLYSLAPNGPEKWGCRIRDLFSKIRDLFSKFETYAVIRDYETKKTAGAAEPPEPPSLAPMQIFFKHMYLHK